MRSLWRNAPDGALIFAKTSGTAGIEREGHATNQQRELAKHRELSFGRQQSIGFGIRKPRCFLPPMGLEKNERGGGKFCRVSCGPIRGVTERLEGRLQSR
jgi:hypothetical protein